MFGVSSGKITALYDTGLITDIPSIYKLNVSDICNVPGFGTVSAKNMIDSIYKSSIQVDLHRWLGALPLRDTSSHTWYAILKYSFGGNSLKAVNTIIHYLTEGTPDEFVSGLKYPVGISDLKIKRIIEGLRLNWDEIKETLKYISFNVCDVIKPTKGCVAMSGTRDKVLSEYLISRGYDVREFNNNVIALIVPDREYKSTKVSKAKSSGIPIYTIQEAYDKL